MLYKLVIFFITILTFRYDLRITISTYKSEA